MQNHLCRVENRGCTAENNVAIIISNINLHQSTPILYQKHTAVMGSFGQMVVTHELHTICDGPLMI